MSASDDIWILGIHMTKFGKHPRLRHRRPRRPGRDGSTRRRWRDDGRHGHPRRRQPDGAAARSVSRSRSRSARPVSPCTTLPTRAPPGPPRCARRSWRSRPASATWASPSGSRSSPGRACSAAGARPRPRPTSTSRPGASAPSPPPMAGSAPTRWPGVFAQVGMEYGHKYGGSQLRPVRQDQREEPRSLHAEPARRLHEGDEQGPDHGTTS